MVFQERIQYTWRDGFPHHGQQAQPVGEALAAIEETYGDLTPELIVATAKAPNSPLHPFIEWNRKKAAAAWQLHQAQSLRNAVRRVVVYYVNEAPRETTVQAFVAHPTDTREDSMHGAHRFLPIDRLMVLPETRTALVRRALRELRAWERRYEAIEELADLCAAVEKRAQQIEEQLEEKAEELVESAN